MEKDESKSKTGWKIRWAIRGKKRDGENEKTTWAPNLRKIRWNLKLDSIVSYFIFLFLYFL